MVAAVGGGSEEEKPTESLLKCRNMSKDKGNIVGDEERC